ncbi:BLUF domain-containing protein [Hymenobacter nivis]|nr:BLUF domain-containing protein [Hymenobacter nivis]
MEDLPTEAARRRAIAWATALVAGTPLAPQQYEAELLERYARGELTLNQVLARLDVRVHHLLYRSRAVHPFSEAQLLNLLEQARTYNAQHDLTGLLCYSRDGHFVQVLEGEATTVHELFAHILRDGRHQQVTVLSDAAGPARMFSDWRMAFAQVEPAEFHWLIGYLEARRQRPALPQIPIDDPHLVALLTNFGAL